MVTLVIADTDRGFLITGSNIPNRIILLDKSNQQLHCCDLNLLTFQVIFSRVR